MSPLSPTFRTPQDVAASAELRKRRTRRRTFLLLVAVSFLVRLYPAVSTVNLTPDAVEYLDLARHNARGEFGAVSLKRHYEDDYPVVYSGSGHRPPLFPLAAGAVLAAFGSVQAVQTANSLLASLAVGVWYLAFAALFSWRVAAGGALAASFSVWFWGSSVIALTEPLSMLLAGLTVWSVTSGRWRAPGGAAGLGALCALAFLTRRMNLMLFPLVLGFLAAAACRRNPGAERLRAAVLCLPFVLASSVVLAPFAVKNVLDFGTPFYDSNTAVLRGGGETFDHYSTRPWGSIRAYVADRGVATVAKAVARGFQRNAQAATVGHGGLGLMSLALPLVALQLLREKQPPAVWFLAGLAGLNWTAYSILGFLGYNDPRFVLLTTFPLCALCLHAVETWPVPRGIFRGKGRSDSSVRYGMAGATLPSTLCSRRKEGPSVSDPPAVGSAVAPSSGKIPLSQLPACTPTVPLVRPHTRFPGGWLVALLVAASVLQGVGVFATMIRRIPAVTIAATPVRVLPEALLRYPPAEYDRLLGELRQHAAPGGVVATGLPWLVHFFTGGPTALLPVDLDTETFPAYLAQYSVHTVVLEPASLGKERFSRYREVVETLAREGKGHVWESGPFVFYRCNLPSQARCRLPRGPPKTAAICRCLVA